MPRFAAAFTGGATAAAAPVEAVPHPDLRDEQLIVGELSSGPIALAHIGTGQWADAPCGYIRYLEIDPSQRALVHATLADIEDRFRQRDLGQARVGAPGYNYGPPFTEDGYLALLLLLQRSYRITYGNVAYSMELPATGPSEKPEDVQLRIESTPEAGQGQLPNARVRLRRRERTLGEAHCFSAWHHGPSRHDQQTFYVGDIDIVEEEQGQGLGRYLLTEVFHAMGQLGYTKVRLSTGVGNLRARLLYASMGFSQGPTEHILMKNLLAEQALGVSNVPIYGLP